ncbi:MAG: LamG domain-containing protein [Planctomycetota bacterium]|nr:LamG domain-containing protein [Planctomycetota bacterium]
MAKTRGSDANLLAHWPLAADALDRLSPSSNSVNHGVTFGPAGDGAPCPSAARFDGQSHIEIPDAPRHRLGAKDFTLSAWVWTDARTDMVGDIASKFDPASRTGLNLGVITHAGVSGSQPNYRNLHAGIDAGLEGDRWTDCGRVGNATKVASMAVHDGELFAGIFDADSNGRGRVFRYAGGQRWIDCGSPDASNCVFSLATFEGELYCGTGRYKAFGSVLPDAPNRTPGGHVYRYAGGKRWVDCGQLVGVRRTDLKKVTVNSYAERGPRAVAASYLCACNGKLYAGATYNWGVYEFQGGKRWRELGLKQRVMGLINHRGDLHALFNGGGDLLRYDGKEWSVAGVLPDTTQSYSAAVHRGKLHIGTWPNSLVVREESPGKWVSTGRTGYNMEVMGMAVYNGKLYAGVLPMADVHRYDGDSRWTWLGNLDPSPAVIKRVWSMAVHNGELFAGTLPAGRVHRLRAGALASVDRALQPGWRHVAAVRKGGRVRLFVDGKPAAESRPLKDAKADLSNAQPLLLGFGAHDYFKGRMADVRLHGKALTAAEVAKVMKSSAGM